MQMLCYDVHAALVGASLIEEVLQRCHSVTLLSDNARSILFLDNSGGVRHASMTSIGARIS